MSDGNATLENIESEKRQTAWTNGVPNAPSKTIYIDDVQTHQKRFYEIVRFTHSSTRAAGIMLIAAIIALIVANSPLLETFEHFIHTQVGFLLGDFTASMSLAHIINDIFMAIFFLLVGLEIKYEMTVGELTNIRQAALPIIAAFGGVCMPALIYTAINFTNPDTIGGWGIPTATDIAFALGILSLLGSRVPNGVRVFLSTLAVADDIIAIIVIAVFYGQSPNFLFLAAAAGVMVVLVVMNRAHVFSLVPYLAVGVVLWICVYMSGVHSTIAGVLLAFTIPTGSRVKVSSFLAWNRDRILDAKEIYDPEQPITVQEDYMLMVSAISRVSKQVVPPATRLEKMLYPWVYFAILPLFALTNADVNFTGGDVVALLACPAMFGVFFGLLLGKPLGIMLMSFIAVKAKIASLPENVNWLHMLGAAILGGVGFTMAIFVANLAFDDQSLIAAAKIGILSASTLAGVIGFLFLFVQAKGARDAGVSYLRVTADELGQTADMEADQVAQATLQEMDSPLTLQEARIALEEGGGHAEIVIEEAPDEL